MKALLLTDYGSCLKTHDQRLVLRNQDSGRFREWLPVEFPYDTVVVENLGGFVTFPALRWLAANGVTLTALAFDGSLLASYLPEVRCRPYERLAQIAAYLDEPTRAEVARFVLESKIGPVPGSLRTLEQLVVYEARKAERFYADLGLTRDYPHARDAANACLNYAFGLLASRARLAVHRASLESSIGFLHAPRNYSSALVWDVMEPFRAQIARTALAVKQELTTRSYGQNLGKGLWLRPEAARRVVRAFAAAFSDQEMDRFVHRLVLRFPSRGLDSLDTEPSRTARRTGGRRRTPPSVSWTARAGAVPS